MPIKSLFKTVTVKKLFCGHASIRDYVVKNTMMKGLGLKIKYQGHTMTVPCEDLAQEFQFHKRAFTSQYNYGKTYELVDFCFVPDSLKE